MVKTPKEALHKSVFERLRKLCLIGFMAIAACLTGSQLFVLNHLDKQLSDARLINLAGRQRMLSQKLSKEVLLLRQEEQGMVRAEQLEKLDNTLRLWKETHRILTEEDEKQKISGKNSRQTEDIYARIQPPFEQIATGAEVILNHVPADSAFWEGEFPLHLKAILANEPLFLEGMDRIVFLYDEEAREKTEDLKKTEVFLLVFALLVLAFIIIFIFIPVSAEVRKVIAGLIQSEDSAIRNAGEISGLYKVLQKSHEELAGFSYALDEATIFAKADKNGKITYISNKFAEITGYSKKQLMGHVGTFVRSLVHSDDFLVKAFAIVRQGGIWHDQLKLHSQSGEVVWLDMTIVPVMNAASELLQVIVMCSDITEKKVADEHYRRLDKKRFDEQIKAQRMKSSLILEGQEDERKRISKDIHDGIGQLLTGLKFQIESINIQDTDKANQKLNDLKNLVKEIIAEVRRISFYLAPGVLEDYGLSSAVSKFVMEAKKYSKEEIVFNNLTGFNQRLESYKEINLYRIIQEGVNNALKYSQAGTIKISLFHDIKKLTLIIQDNGKGFILEEVLRQEGNSVGNGLYNMQERAMYADGKLEIQSGPGAGTKIYVQIPI